MKKAIFITALFWLVCSNCSAQFAYNNAIRIGEEFTFFSKWKGYPQYYSYKKMWNVEYIRNVTPKFYIKANYYKIYASIKALLLPMGKEYRDLINSRIYSNSSINLGYNYWRSINEKHLMNAEIGLGYRKKIFYNIDYWYYNNIDFPEAYVSGYLSKQLGANLNLNYSFFPTRFLEWNVFVNGRFYTRDKALPVIQRENTISVGTNIGFRFGSKKK